jgi:hypothetical protein
LGTKGCSASGLRASLSGGPEGGAMKGGSMRDRASYRLEVR